MSATLAFIATGIALCLPSRRLAGQVALFFDILLAICFVGSSGVYFAARFATNSGLKFIVGAIAIVSTVLLILEVSKDVQSFLMGSSVQEANASASSPNNPLEGRVEDVLLVNGKDSKNRDVFAFVIVPHFRLREFLDAQDKGMFYPQKYGRVILSGLGEPSQADFDIMARNHGFDQRNIKYLK